MESAIDTRTLASSATEKAHVMADSTEQTGQDGIGQEEIEQLLKQAESARAAVAGAGSDTSKPDATMDPADVEAVLRQRAAGPSDTTPSVDSTTRDVEMLLNHAQAALASAAAGTGALPPGVSQFKFEDLSGAAPSTDVATFDLIRDVELDLKIELGRTHMYLEDVLKLRKGSVVTLDKLAGDPVEVYVNGRLIARGEVLVMNDNFCVRVAQLVESDRVDAA
jgi:flagellar motor switch protein FliN/FliY